MKITKNNIKGFSHLEFFLFVIILFVIMGVGYRVYSASISRAVAYTSSSIVPPSNLQLNAVSTTEAALRWSPSSTSGVSYEVLRNGVVVGQTVSYTTNFLNVGLTPGKTYSYTVLAKQGSTASHQTTPLSVTTGSSTIPISACGATISASGNYVLQKSISIGLSGNTNGACINIVSTKNVSLDCKGHSIDVIANNVNDEAIYLSYTNNFLISNCTTYDSLRSASESGIFNDFTLQADNNGTLEYNNFGNSYKLYGNIASDVVLAPSSNIIINKNGFYNATYFGVNPQYFYVGNNNFTWDGNTPALSEAGNIVEYDGVHNTIYNNTIRDNFIPNPTAEGSQGVLNETPSENDKNGVDDGINIGAPVNESGAYSRNEVVAYNTISNVYDCGIEGVGYITGATITHNNINDAAIGMCSYWYTSWLGNTVSYNKDSVGKLFKNAMLFNFYPASYNTTEGTYFLNNQFTNNSFATTAVSNTYSCPTVDSESDLVSFYFYELNTKTVKLGNDLFKNNNLGHYHCYNLNIMPNNKMIVDGGGNICNNWPPGIDPGVPPPQNPFINVINCK